VMDLVWSLVKIRCLVVGAAAAAAAIGAGPASAGGEVVWKNGLRYSSEDGAHEITLGGRLFNDWVWMDGNGEFDAAFGNLEDGTEMRAARLCVSGTLWESVVFKERLEFAGGEVAFTDAWVGVTGVPGAGTIRAGLMREPSGLRTSSKHLTFLERSIAEALARPRNTGVLSTDTAAGGRVQWAAGVFRSSGTDGEHTGDGEYAISGRITGLPRYSRDGRGLIHVGVSGGRAAADGDRVRFSERPGAHLAPKLVDTGDIAADAYRVVGWEAGLVEGPLFAQAEALHASVDRIGGEDPAFAGWSVEASVFLTGEHRSYDKAAGVFGRVVPRRNFDSRSGGAGAFEAAVRVSRLDLDDAGVWGGVLTDVTLGLNWYLNPNARVMANLVRARVDGAGAAVIGQARLQVDF